MERRQQPREANGRFKSEQSPPNEYQELYEWVGIVLSFAALAYVLMSVPPSCSWICKHV